MAVFLRWRGFPENAATSENRWITTEKVPALRQKISIRGDREAQSHFTTRFIASTAP
jgi:hypothetical protein